jgi:hypothetical protein
MCTSKTWVKGLDKTNNKIQVIRCILQRLLSNIPKDVQNSRTAQDKLVITAAIQSTIAQDFITKLNI